MTRRTARIALTLLACHRWLLWGAAVVVVAMVAIAIGFAASGTPEHSIWESAGQPARWMLFATGVITTPLTLRPYIALGVTRRTFAGAAGLAALMLVTAAVMFLAAGLLVERAIYAAAGRPYSFNSEHLFTGAGQVHLIALEYALVLAAYLAGGWIVGGAFYRFGGRRGLLAIPPGIVPAIAVENLLGTGQWTGFGPPALGLLAPELPLALAAGLALAALALAGAGGYRLFRSMPIRTC